MDVGAIDRSATSGDSLLHRASPGAKLIGAALVILAVVASTDPLALSWLTLALLTAVLTARLNLKLALGLALYPAIFAVVFAFASAPTAEFASAIVLKAVASALAAVTVVLTTPYPLVFSKIQLVVPGIAGDALLMTYRTFFLLAERFANLTTAVRLRSAGAKRAGLAGSVKSISAALGNTVLYAFDLAERDYDILHLRGYSGRLRVESARSSSPLANVVIVGAGLAAAASAVLWRFTQPRALGWTPLIMAAALLIVALAWRRMRGTRD